MGVRKKSSHKSYGTRMNRNNREFNEDELINSNDCSLLGGVFTFVLDITMRTLALLAFVLRPVVPVVILVGIVCYIYPICQDIVLEAICPLPIIGPRLPMCLTYVRNVPDFTHLIKLQESLYDGMLSQPSNSISALELKRVELATRDLQAIVKYSNLVSHELLETKLGEYISGSRRFGKDIRSLQSQTKGVIDNLITYNTFTLRKLSEVNSKTSSRQELRALYENAMALVEKEARRLILAIEKAQGSLDLLEEDLYAVHEISVQEKLYQKSEKPHILADLVNMLKGKGAKRPLIKENMDLLVNFDFQRSKAAQQLMVMLDRMEAFQMDLEELRAQVATPILVPDALPLEMHIENIGKAIERLKQGKVIAWEANPQIEATPSASLV